MIASNEKWESVVAEKIQEHLTGRGKKKRGWIALHKSVLNGSINYRMEMDEQGAFFKLILVADELGPVPGLISDNDFRPIPHEYIASVMHCPVDVLERCIEKGLADDALYENSHGIFFTHFDEYQFTEYDRQKGYRQKWRDEKRTAAMSPKDTAAADRENQERIAKYNEMHGKDQGGGG